MSILLTTQEKILEFLRSEFAKIKAEHNKQKASKKFKPRILEKMIRKLHHDIELILKTESLDGDLKNKIIELKQELNYSDINN